MFISPNWPAPKNIKALCTTRQGGVSEVPFESFNIATHVGDKLEFVLANRQKLLEQAKLPGEPVWLDQQHTDIALELSESLVKEAASSERLPLADASWTTQPGLVSVVMTADCLPVLITNQAGTLVAAIHAGWKGLQQGIVSKTIAQFIDREDCLPGSLIAWIGPAISVQHFEVGEDVRQAFIACDKDNDAYFHPRSELSASQSGELAEPKYLADLAGLVTKELHELGVSAVYGGDRCSYEEETLFYSYRRSGQTGRMASLIWIDSSG